MLLSLGLRELTGPRGNRSCCNRKFRSLGARAESLPCCEGSGGALSCVSPAVTMTRLDQVRVLQTRTASEGLLPTSSWAFLSVVELFRRLAQYGFCQAKN